MFFQLILIISSIGFALLGNHLLKRSSVNSVPEFKSYGTLLAVGLGLIPALLVVLNILFRIPLDIAAKVIFVLSLSGYGTLFLKSNFVNLQENLLFYLTHPANICFILILLIETKLFREYNFAYGPREWDEYPIWLFYPQQFIHFKEFSSKAFLFQSHITYSPGWTSLIAFPFLTINKGFSFFPTLGLGYILKAIFYGAFYDTLFNILSRFKVNFLLKIAISLSLSIFLFTSDFFPYWFARGLLIEMPQYLLAGILFLFLFDSGENLIKNPKLLIINGLLITFLFLIKKPTALIVPICALYIGFLSFPKSKPFFSQEKFREVVKYMALSFLPFFSLFIIWKLETRSYLNIYPLFEINYGVHGSVSGLMTNIYKMIPAIFEGLKKTYTIESLTDLVRLMVGLLPLCLLFKKTRGLSLVGIAWLLINFVGLVHIYVVTKGIIDVNGFFAFDRYMTVPYYSSGIITIVSLFYLVSSFIFPKLEVSLKRLHFVEKWKLPLVIFISGVILLKPAWEAYVIKGDYYSHHTSINNYWLHKAILDSHSLGDKMREKGVGGEHVIFMGERGNDEVERIYHYAMAGAIGDKGINFHPQYTFIEKYKSKEILESYLRRYEVIWPVTESGNALSFLYYMIDNDECKKNINDYFLFKEVSSGEMKFSCAPKDKPGNY